MLGHQGEFAEEFILPIASVSFLFCSKIWICAFYYLFLKSATFLRVPCCIKTPVTEVMCGGLTLAGQQVLTKPLYHSSPQQDGRRGQGGKIRCKKKT